MNGVKKPMRKFHVQFEAVAKAMQVARYWIGYISAQITHGRGPQVVANPIIAKQENTTMKPPASDLEREQSLSMQ